jgi:hypothetical protein
VIIWLWLISQLAVIAAVTSAAVLASKGVEGWGWFLVIALLISPSIKGGGSAADDGQRRCQQHPVFHSNLKP